MDFQRGHPGDDWARIEQQYHVGDTLTARITKLTRFSAEAELEPGVEGWVHISELSDERITDPREAVREGQTVKLKIIFLNPQRRRIGLSLRRAEEPPSSGPSSEPPQPSARGPEGSGGAGIRAGLPSQPIAPYDHAAAVPDFAADPP